MGQRSAAERWEDEARFFDAVAAGRDAGLTPLEPSVLDRYARPRRLYPKECAVSLLSGLAGLHVLDVGCGDGENSVLLARLGARVTGLDVSSGAIALAEKRARMEGVLERTRFVCAPVATARLEARQFDAIWVDNVLHHLLDELPATLSALCGWARPGALFVAIEPTNRAPLLRRVRRLLPVHTDATPDERPLEERDLQVLRAHLEGLRIEPFLLLSRLSRFVLPCLQYEKANRPRRLVADLLAAADAVLLRHPRIAELGGVSVLHGRVR
jgi:2-polyprenyl-3-methyl-5-hydroxy-6-metoxy-1,4-benzoquinol methylase